MRGFRRVAHLTAFSAVARVPGLLIPLLIGAAFGAGPDTDGYFLAYGAVLLVGGTMAAGIESATVPFSARAGGGPRNFEDTTVRRVLLTACLIWAGAVPLVVIAAPALLAPKVARLGILLTPLAVLWPGCAVYSGALIARWRIAQASASMLWRGIGAIIGVGFALAGGGLGAVAVGLGLGEAGRFWWLRRDLLRTVRPETTVPAPEQRGFGSAASAQVFSGAAGTGAAFVERFLATTLGAGSVSRLEYAARLFVIPALFFEGGLAPLLLARWSNDRAQNLPPARRLVIRAVGGGIGAAVLIAGFIALLAPIAVRVVLGHGRLTPEDISAIAGLLRLFSLGFIATMGALLLERLYLAHSRNRLLAGLSILRGTVRLGLVILCLHRLGLSAFAVGYVTADWVYLLALIAGARTMGLVKTPARAQA